MTRSEIIDLLKQGCSNDEIIRRYIVNQFATYDGWRRIARDFNFAALKAEIGKPGFVEDPVTVLTYSHLGRIRHEQAELRKGGFSVFLERREQLLRIHFCHSKLSWNITDHLNVLPAYILIMLERIPKAKEEAEHLLCVELPKLRKMVDIGNATIDTTLQALLPQSGLTYNISKDYEGNTYLRIKLRYRRSIVINLLPTMDMAHLSTLLETITKAQDLLNSVGNLNLTVKNYGNNIEWETGR